jgi:hypothetical protein
MHYITHVTEDFPTNLVNATDIAIELHISVENLLSYTLSGHCPHYRIDDGEPVFKKSEVKKWAAKNIIKKCEGKDFPDKLLIINTENPENILDVPPSLRLLKDIRKVPTIIDCAGVYFLCQAEEIVYIGQSINLFARISEHSKNKDFDTAYFIPVPAEFLNEVEGSLIRHFIPKLNGKQSNGNPCAPYVRKEKQEFILKKLTNSDKNMLSLVK